MSCVRGLAARPREFGRLLDLTYRFPYDCVAFRRRHFVSSLSYSGSPWFCDASRQTRVYPAAWYAPRRPTTSVARPILLSTSGKRELNMRRAVIPHWALALTIL